MKAIHTSVAAIAAACCVSGAAAQQATQQPTTGAQTAPAYNGPATDAPGSEPAEATLSSQEATGGEIIVTAQRRSESAQRVPISLTVLDAATIENQGIKTILDLQRSVPSFSVQRAQQAANTRLAIRGIGSSGNTAIEPSVGAFVDGVYIARPGSLLAGLNDIASVEVLRGPQGTLFGRNASMGAISFHTALPARDARYDFGAEYGSYDRRRLSAVVNQPLTDTTGLRLAGLYERFDGYGSNVLTGRDYGRSRLASLRGTLRSDLTSNLTWTVRGDYQRLTGDGIAAQSVLANTVTATARANFITRTGNRIPDLDNSYTFKARHTTDGLSRDRQWGASSDLDLDLGGFSLRLLSAYRDWHTRQFERDASQTAADIFGRDARYSSKTHSEELQLTSPDTLLDGRLNFVAGLYYYKEDYAIGEVFSLGTGYCSTIVAFAAPGRLAACNAGPKAVASTFAFDQRTESYAAYGQATFNLTDALHLTGGIRYSHDDKDADLDSRVFNTANLLRVTDLVPGLRFSGGKVTYRLNATYDIAADIIAFATYATGYKSGGFDAGNGTALGRNRVFRPETTSNYEAGVKAQFLDRRITANATLFRTDVEDFQLRSYNGTAFSVRNAGSIRQQGVEFELTGRPASGLTLGVTGTRLDSRYTDFRNAPGLPGFGGVQDLTGRRAPTSPKWQGVASANYEGDLSRTLRWSLSGNLAFQSLSDVGVAGDANPQGFQRGYALLGARIGIAAADQRWEVYLAGDNLTDKGYCTVTSPQPLNGPLGLNNPVTGGTVQRCYLGDPRTVRAGIKIRI